MMFIEHPYKAMHSLVLVTSSSTFNYTLTYLAITQSNFRSNIINDSHHFKINFY